MTEQRNQKINEILDSAGVLFTTKGYDNTSINDILFDLGIAKGTLYHYFKSKEAILDALIARINREMKTRASLISQNKEVTILERMIQTIMSLNLENDGGHEEVIEIIHQPQNALMHQKIEKVILADITPILTDLIIEGIEEGIFETEYPYEAAEMLLSYSLSAFSKSDEIESEEEMIRKMTGFVYNMERLLGTSKGALNMFFQVFSS